MSNQRIILVSQFINSFGSGFSRVALIILVTQWFHQPLALGGLTFCLFVPGGPFSGAHWQPGRPAITLAPNAGGQ